MREFLRQVDQQFHYHDTEKPDSPCSPTLCHDRNGWQARQDTCDGYDECTECQLAQFLEKAEVGDSFLGQGNDLTRVTRTR